MRGAAVATVLLLTIAAPARGASQQPVASFERPVVTLTRPSAWSSMPLGHARVVAGSSIAVEGRITAPDAIQSVEIDGARAALRRLEPGNAWFTGFVSPPARAGALEVELRIRLEHGDERVVWLPVEVEAAPDSPPAPERFQDLLRYPARERYAVVVGIDDYPDPDIEDLEFAEEDARAFADFLRSDAAGDGGLPGSHVHLLTGEEATARNIRAALNEVRHRATNRDIVYLYLAGRVGPEPDRVDPLYLYSHDAERGQLPGTAVEFDDLRKFLQEVQAYQTVVLADADRSGMIQQENRRGVFANVVRQAFTGSMEVAQGGLLLITATEGGGASQESVRWGGGHGIFTYVILEGLRGGADADGDGVVTLEELARYTIEGVREATEGGQVPANARTSYDRYWPVALVGGG